LPWLPLRPYAMGLACCEGSPTECADTTYTGVRREPLGTDRWPFRARDCLTYLSLLNPSLPSFDTIEGSSRSVYRSHELPRRSRSRAADARCQNNQFLSR